MKATLNTTGFNKVTCTMDDVDANHTGCIACGGTKMVIGHEDDIKSGLIREDEVLELEVYTNCTVCDRPYRDFVSIDPAKEHVHICGICYETIH